MAAHGARPAAALRAGRDRRECRRRDGAVEAVPPATFETREREPLVLAKRWMPRLRSVVPICSSSTMGKNISAGHDINVVGGSRTACLTIRSGGRRLFVRELTADIHGNAYGIGIADFDLAPGARDRLPDDHHQPHDGRASRGGRHPDPLRRIAMRSMPCSEIIGLLPPERARVVRIRNTPA
jgi:hypothetical protein